MGSVSGEQNASRASVGDLLTGASAAFGVSLARATLAVLAVMYTGARPGRAPEGRLGAKEPAGGIGSGSKGGMAPPGALW